jgi:phage-related minor tail protein
MALRIGSLYVSLTANSTGLVKGFAEAAKAAERVAKDVKRASAEVAQVAGTFAALGGAAVKLAASVDGPTKNALAGLERSTKLLAVQIADMLLPAVKAISEMFRTMAGVVAGLDPETKKSISSFAVLAVQLAIAAKGLSLVASISANVFGALRAVAAVVAGIGVGPLLSFGIAIAGVIALAVLLHRAWRKNWGGIQEATASVVEWIRDAFGQLANFIGGVWDFLVDGAAKFIDSLLDVVDALQSVTGKKLINTGGLREGFAGLFKDLKSGSFFSEAFKFGKGIGQQVAEGLAEEFAAIKKELGLDDLLKGGKTIGLGRGMGPAAPKGPAVSGAVAPQFNGINAGGAWLHEMDRLAKDTQKHADDIDKVRGLELRNRLAIASDLEKQKRVAGAIQSGTVSSLTGGARADAEKQMAGTVDSAVNAGSWGEAMDTLEAGLQGSLTFGKELEVWGKRMSGLIGSAGKQILGAVGDLVDSVVQGAQAGGVWGAIIAAFMEIAKKTASAMKFLDTAMAFVGKLAEMVEPLIAPIFDALTDVLAAVLNAVGPLFASLQPLFDAFSSIIKDLMPIFDGLGYVFQAIGPILEFIGRLVQSLGPLIKIIFEIIGGVLKVVATVVLGIIIALNEIAAAFGDEAAKAESGRLKGIVDKMWDPNDGAAQDAARENTRATIENTQATNNLSQATESLTNVPTGYKLALGRFDADMGITPSNAFAGGGGGGTTINGDVFVTSTATTVDDLAEDAAKEARRDRGQERGNPSRGRGRGGDN